MDGPDYAAQRRALLEEFDGLTGGADVLEWQIRLAAAIADAERDSNGPHRVEAKRQRHLLRVIGDGLVHSVLPAHTIRTLSRSPGKPAHITSQRDDFEFVLARAHEFQAAGGLPILADLTTLIGVGDLVLLLADGIAVLECKNRDMPARPPSGRVARQAERGFNAARYLSESYIEEEGTARIAVEFTLAEPDYAAVEDVVGACIAAPTSLAVHQFGIHDVLIAATDEVATAELDAMIPRVMDGANGPSMAIAFLGDLIESAAHRRISPSNYPLPADMRCRLLEREIQLSRLINTDRLACEFSVGDRVLRLEPRMGAAGLEVKVTGVTGADELIYTSEVVEMCLWSPISIDAVRESIVAEITSVLAESDGSDGLLGQRAPGDLIRYATVYRPSEGSRRP